MIPTFSGIPHVYGALQFGALGFIELAGPLGIVTILILRGRVVRLFAHHLVSLPRGTNKESNCRKTCPTLRESCTECSYGWGDFPLGQNKQKLETFVGEK